MVERKIKGWIQLFRPELPFAAGVCVVLGEIIAFGNFPSLRESLLGFLTAFFISSSALILNDYFDLEVDKTNAPDRPLPSGAVSAPEAIALTVITTLTGLAASFLASLQALILAVIAWSVGALYNWRFKQAGLLGNLMVAACVGFTFILGGVIVGQPLSKIVWFFGLIAFLVDLAEEIAGDAMDVEGDRKRDSRSLAITLGKRVALRISAALFVLVVLLSFVPFILGWMGIPYLIVISILGVLTLVSTFKLASSRTPEEGRRFMRWIYLGALFGMLAFIIGRLFA